MHKYKKLMIFISVGALLGYAWYYFYGCTNGCAITSSWSKMTIIGALFGGIIGFPTKSNDSDKNNSNTEE